MPKNKKDRQVLQPPLIVYFKPQGIPMVQLQQVTLSVDEYEAIRLADHESLKHNEAAEKMKISRPTFTRLLDSAHKKTADALVNGKAVRIEGGNFILSENMYQCKSCSNTWQVKSSEEALEKCPRCGSESINDLGKQCGYRGHGRGRGRKKWDREK